MSESEFDEFAPSYKEQHAANIRVSGESPEFFAEYKIADVARMYERNGLSPPRSILDFGGGIGASVAHFKTQFPSAEISCLDVSQLSVEIARATHKEAANFVLFDGLRVPFRDHSFDLVFSACVFHHISKETHPIVFEEIFRVLRPGGSIVVFEHNPLNPLTVYAVKTCPFDANAKLLFAGELRRQIRRAGFSRSRIQYRVFFPRVLGRLRPLEKWLRWLPLGAQYFVRAERPGRS